MQRTKIDWPGLDYTWNPVIGCKRNCSYCYAKRMNTRFKWIPEWTDPQYFPERLDIPLKVKKPSTFFVGSISDICFWKPEWMEAVLTVCDGCPQHTFMFLTKDPETYFKHKFPKNSWLGCTCEFVWKNEIMKNYVSCMVILSKKLKHRTYLSLEPLSARVGEIPKEIELVIVGADTSPGAKPPKQEWIDSIKHPNIHYKENILKYMR